MITDNFADRHPAAVGILRYLRRQWQPMLLGALIGFAIPAAHSYGYDSGQRDGQRIGIQHTVDYVHDHPDRICPTP